MAFGVTEQQFETDLRKALDTLHWQGTELDVDGDATIRPDPQTLDPTINICVGDLPQLSLPVEEGEPALDFGDILAIGGMGVVQLATQRALNREVAVKRLKAGLENAENTQALLHEAWLNGALEHPNINPIYLLGRDELGLPIFAMRKIEGTPWRALIDNPEEAQKLSGTSDILLFHLNILMQVCNAVHYSHSKGILHRDVKSENVMIGHFGEVYLLDWGIAVSISEDAEVRGIPSAKNSRGVAGTPTHMAPEMVAGDSSKLSERTDVFLLGATLHMILTGEPRHMANSLPAIIMKAFRSERVDYGQDVPVDLGAIANKATARNPADRYESSEALRQALAQFIEHRNSLELSRQAGLRAEELRSLLNSDDSLSEEAMQKAYSLLAECRFGYQQARQIWQDNDDAVTGLQEALELMIEYQLGRRALRAVSGLISELPERNPALEKRLADLEIELDAEKIEFEKLRRIERDIDVTLGTKARALVCLTLAVLWGLPDLVIGFLEVADKVHPGYLFVTGRSVIYTITLALATWVGRNALLGNVANRRIIGSGFVTFGAQFIVWPLCWAMGLPLETAITMVLACFTVIGATMGISIDRPIFLAAVFLLLCCIGSALYPAFSYGWLGLAGLTSMGAVSIVWWPKKGRTLPST